MQSSGACTIMFLDDLLVLCLCRRYIDQGIAELIPGVLFIDEAVRSI